MELGGGVAILILGFADVPPRAFDKPSPISRVLSEEQGAIQKTLVRSFANLLACWSGEVMALFGYFA